MLFLGIISWKGASCFNEVVVFQMGPSFLSRGHTPWGASVFEKKCRMGGVHLLPPPTMGNPGYVLTAAVCLALNEQFAYQKCTLQSSTMSLLFKNRWVVEVTYQVIRFSEARFFPWNTKNTDRYGVNKQSKNHHSICQR